MLRTFRERLSQFLISEDGPTAVEYAVMLGLIIVLCIASIGFVGDKSSKTFGGTSKAIVISAS